MRRTGRGHRGAATLLLVGLLLSSCSGTDENGDAAVVTSLLVPDFVSTGQTGVIEVGVRGAGPVTVEFDASSTSDSKLTVRDDGRAPDAVAGDGSITLRAPAFADQVAVRVHAAGHADAGRTDGYLMGDGGPTADRERLDLYFLEETAFDDLVDDPSGVDETLFPVVVAFGGRVVSGEVRLKGEWTRQFQKRSFKLRLDDGSDLDVFAGAEPADEFHLNADTGANPFAARLAWSVFEDAGVPVPSRARIALYQDGELLGRYTAYDKYEDPWLAEHPEFGDGQLVEEGSDPMLPDDGGLDEYRQWIDDARSLEGTQRLDWFYRTVDVPAVINVLAVQALVRNVDVADTSNLLSYRRPEGLWGYLPWDLDQTFAFLPPLEASFSPTGTVDFVNPDRRPLAEPEGLMLATIVHGDPHLRSMYLRRLRTLFDAELAEGRLIDRLDEWSGELRALEHDWAVWGDDQYDLVYRPIMDGVLGRSFSQRPAPGTSWTPSESQLAIETLARVAGLEPGDPETAERLGVSPGRVLEGPDDLFGPTSRWLRLRHGLIATAESPARAGFDGLPARQPERATVELIDLGSDTGDTVRLVAGSQSVDVSGWTIEPLQVPLPPGTVVPEGEGLIVHIGPSAPADVRAVWIPAEIGADAHGVRLLRPDGSDASQD